MHGLCTYIINKKELVRGYMKEGVHHGPWMHCKKDGSYTCYTAKNGAQKGKQYEGKEDSEMQEQ